ncbi:MAG: RidA family protein [Steroidobacteraceae bacterium]
MDGTRFVVPVATDRAPAPAGHYAQATIAGSLLYVSGQLPIRADGTLLAGATFEEQASQALDNVLAIVAAAGGAPLQIARVTAYIVGVAHWPRFNAIYAAKLGAARPARTVVPVPELHHGVLVEIDAIAIVGA